MANKLDMQKLKEKVEEYAAMYIHPDKLPTAKIDDAGTEEESLTFGMVVVYYGETEHKTIASSVMLPCYDIGTIIEYGGGYWEPPEADFQSITEATNVWDAAAKVITTHLELEISAHMNSNAEYEYWQEQQKLDAQMREEDQP